MGQSNMAFFFSGVESPNPTQETKALVYNANNLSFEAGGGGNGIRRFCIELVARSGLPVMVIHSTQAGSGINGFVPGSVRFTELQNALSLLGSRVHAVIWHQGENEGDGSQVPSIYTNYTASIANIHSAIASIAGVTVNDIPFILSSLSTYGATGKDVGWTNIDNHHKLLPSLLPNVHWSDSWKDAVRIDSFHSYGESYGRRGTRVAHHVAHRLGYVPTQGRFDVATATATNTTTTTVTVAHALGTDFSVGSITHLGGNSNISTVTDIVGFEVTEDNWATSVACTGVRTNATTITLTHDSVPTVGRKIRYLYGANPAMTGFVRDNGPLLMPLTHFSTMDVA
jgi:hypothetical protein